MNDGTPQAPPLSFRTNTPAPVAPPRRLRLWPGLVIVALQWLVMFGAGWIAPGEMIHFYAMFMTPFVAAIAIIFWWLLASRLPWSDRLLGLAACAAIGGAAAAVSDESMLPLAILFYGLPVVTTAWVLWLLVALGLSERVRSLGLVVVFALGWGFFALLRFEGVWGDMAAQFHWRWEPTHEQRFLAQLAGRKGAPA